MRRRSSLPSSLQAPSRLLPPKRRNSGHLSPKEVTHVQNLPINENNSFSSVLLASEQTPLNPDDILPPRQRKRYSWEDESVAAREDLLTVSPPNTRSVRNSGNSWQDGLSPVKESFKEQEPQISTSNAKSPEEFQPTQPPSETAPKIAEQPSTPVPPRSMTPTQSRSRSTTPVPGIRPPPGPAPPASPTLTRKVSPPSGGKRGVRSGSNASATLQPNLAHTRPRAGSAASMSSMSSMNSFTLDGILTPPPPSSPLPSLPPTAGLPSVSSSPKIGLGITRTRKSSGASRELLPAPQLVLESASLPTPTSSEIAHTTTASSLQMTTGVEPTQIVRLKKRVSILEKELANTEIELSSRIRDGSELQFKVEQLTIERDTLQSRMKLLEVHVNESAKRNERERQRESIELDRVSLQLQHDQQLQEAVKQIQDEKEVLFEALMERQDRSRMEMSAQMETLRRQLADKEQEINRLKSEQQDQMDQQLAGNAFLTSPTRQTQEMGQEIARLQALQASLEQELTSARNEIHRLQSLAADQKQNLSKDQRAREELEVKVEALMMMSDDHEQAKRDKTEFEQLRQETLQLRADKVAQEERFLELQRDLEASTSRSQQEEAQYRTLQDTVQRLSSKITRMEGQHASELEQVQRDHEEVMERVVQEHAQALTDVSEQAQSESRSQRSQIERLEAQFSNETKELQARERVLRERLSEQSLRNDQLEAQLFLLEKAQTTHEAEKETMARTNRSLERHLSMQHLQEQENIYKMEELERENAKMRAVLAELDMAAYQSRRQQNEQQQDNEEDEVSRATMATVYETQQRRWAEQTQLMERKMAKTEEEARAVMEKNMQLEVALEMAQSGSSPSSSDDKPRSHSP
ncbi:hypothetical protein BGZ52_000478 [Haplosporangium bisporale]|nr:hypothetical protein BGZ52_000478 [Haplosporangium bisporale]